MVIWVVEFPREGYNIIRPKHYKGFWLKINITKEKNILFYEVTTKSICQKGQKI